MIPRGQKKPKPSKAAADHENKGMVTMHLHIFVYLSCLKLYYTVNTLLISALSCLFSSLNYVTTNVSSNFTLLLLLLLFYELYVAVVVDL